MKSIENAALYEAGPENATFSVVHIYGDPYERGYALGTIQKDTIREFISKTWTYLTELVVDSFPGDTLSQGAKIMITDYGMIKALDWCAKTTKEFIPQAYFDEMRGIADATGVSYDMIVRLNLCVFSIHCNPFFMCLFSGFPN